MGEKCYFISEASKLVGVEAHVLRYWEEQLELPIKRNEMGHRYYIEEDIRLMQSIKQIMEKGIQLRAVKMILPGLMEHREDILMELTGAVLEPLNAPEKESGQETEAETDAWSGTGERDGAGGRQGIVSQEKAEHPEATASREKQERQEDVTRQERMERQEVAASQEMRIEEPEAEEWPSDDYLEEEDPDSLEELEYEEDGEEAMEIARAEEVEEMLSGGQELAANREFAVNHEFAANHEFALDQQEVVESSREMRMLQFQEIMSNLIGQALQRNNAELAAATSEHVAERVIKEMDYQMRVRDSQEEERYKKLDETIRSLQKSRAGKRFRRGKR